MFCNEDYTLHFTYCFPPHYIHATQCTRSSMFMQFWNRLALSTRIFKQTTCGGGALNEFVPKTDPHALFKYSLLISNTSSCGFMHIEQTCRFLDAVT